MEHREGRYGRLREDPSRSTLRVGNSVADTKPCVSAGPPLAFRACMNRDLVLLTIIITSRIEFQELTTINREVHRPHLC
jgi:hypothetical protein